MLLRLQNAYASMTEMMRRQEQSANNLANAGTVGYKRDRTFTEALNERLDEEFAPRSERAATQWAELAPGSLESTGNPLDVALGGDGFFALLDEASGASRYTRAGRFTLDSDGMLRDPMGFAVEGENGPIQIPPGSGDIKISKNGDIQAGQQLVGRLRIVRFENPLQLSRLDGAAFDAGNMEPLNVDSSPVVRQGFVETSNVDPVREMTDMIAHFRLFESQQKSLQATDQVLGNITRDLGKF